MQKYQEEVWTWTIISVIKNINISNYKPVSGRSYIKFSKELNHSEKLLINIQNTNDNECLKCFWCRYLFPAYHNPVRFFLKIFFSENLILKRKKFL